MIMDCGARVTLTISPFILIGGSHETMTFVFDAGIAFMSAGADGAKCVCVQVIQKRFRINFAPL